MVLYGVGGPEEGANHCAPVTAIAPDHGVGDDTCREVVVVFPGEIESGREGLVDVTGWAEDRPDDFEVGAVLAFGSLAGGEPVSRFRHDGIANGDALPKAEMKPGKTVGRAEDIGVAVGQGHVLLHEGPWIGVVGKGGKEGGDLGEAPDVFIPDSAFAGFLPLRVAGEEAAMVFLEIGVAVPPRGQHAADVGVEPRVRVVSSLLSDQGEELLRELVIDGVVSGLEKLVVMDAPDTPEWRLIVEDVALFVQGLVAGAPEDAVRVGVTGGLVGVERSVVADEGGPVIIPVPGQGEGVGDQGSEEGFGCKHGG